MIVLMEQIVMVLLLDCKVEIDIDGLSITAGCVPRSEVSLIHWAIQGLSNVKSIISEVSKVGILIRRKQEGQILDMYEVKTKMIRARLDHASSSCQFIVHYFQGSHELDSTHTRRNL